MKFYQETLPNGLTVIGEYRESAVSAALGFFVKTGARDETSEVSGVSHFLEHMMFKGTEKRSALDITFDMGAIGAQANAYTSEECTVYYMAVLPEYFEKAFDILSDMMRSSLTQEEFDVEKKVILEEIALYQDRPSFLIFEAALSKFFEDHKAGSSVLGTIDSITALTREQMKTYFDARYSPDNMVLACSGNFDWEEVLKLANDRCGSWEKTEASRELEPHVASEKSVEITKEGINRAHMCLMTPGPSAQGEFRYEADVLSCILGDSSGSKVYWELIDKGIADSVSIGTDFMDACGMIYAYAGFDPKNEELVRDKLKAILADAMNFTEKDLERAKTKIRTRIVLQGENSMRRLMAIGNAWLARKEYLTLEEQQQRYKQVDTAAIAKLIKTHSLSPITDVTLVPAS